MFSASLLMSCQQQKVKSADQTSANVEVTAVSETSRIPKLSPPIQSKTKELSFTATIKYMNLEGGFFGLITKEGKHWLPMNLKKEFHQDGAVIKVQGHEIKGMMTIQQWGTPFSITHIELISAGRKNVGNNLS